MSAQRFCTVKPTVERGGGKVEGVFPDKVELFSFYKKRKRSSKMNLIPPTLFVTSSHRFLSISLLGAICNQHKAAEDGNFSQYR